MGRSHYGGYTMKHSIKTFLLASGIAMGGVAGASAATLDFTDFGSYIGYNASGATGSIGSVDWTLSAVGGALKVDTNPDVGDSTGISLALATDGVGVGSGDDEVTNNDEALLLEFSRAIKVTAVHVLDLFFSVQPPGLELALAYDDATDTMIVQLAAGVPLGDATGGYAMGSFAEFAVKKMRFEAGGTADNPTGTFDFALAAVEYAASEGNEPDPVPLPAGGLLLLGALGGLAALRRRAA